MSNFRQAVWTRPQSCLTSRDQRFPMNASLSSKHIFHRVFSEPHPPSSAIIHHHSSFSIIRRGTFLALVVIFCWPRQEVCYPDVTKYHVWLHFSSHPGWQSKQKLSTCESDFAQDTEPHTELEGSSTVFVWMSSHILIQYPCARYAGLCCNVL